MSKWKEQIPFLDMGKQRKRDDGVLLVLVKNAEAERERVCVNAEGRKPDLKLDLSLS